MTNTLRSFGSIYRARFIRGIYVDNYNNNCAIETAGQTTVRFLLPVNTTSHWNTGTGEGDSSWLQAIEISCD